MRGAVCLAGENVTPQYQVRLAVPRIGGLRAWGLAEGDFERRLTAQASTMVSEPHIAGETRRGRDYLRVTIVMTVVAADVGQALVLAWRVFRKAAGDDLGVGWATASASAEVRPESISRKP
jgi:hypothetical protein